MNPTASTSPRRLTGTNVWACKSCKSHLSYDDDIVSKKFQGIHGRAFLMREVINIRIGKPETKLLLTGKHDISSVYCQNCDNYLGWKYIAAPNSEQSYKLGHVLLERAKISKDGQWI